MMQVSALSRIPGGPGPPCLDVMSETQVALQRQTDEHHCAVALACRDLRA